MKRRLKMTFLFAFCMMIAFIAGRTVSRPKPPALAAEYDRSVGMTMTARRDIDLRSVTPKEFVAKLEDIYGVSIEANWMALEAWGLNFEHRGDLVARNVTLPQAIRAYDFHRVAAAMHEHVVLTMHEERLVLTTPEIAESLVVTRVYDIDETLLLLGEVDPLTTLPDAEAWWLRRMTRDSGPNRQGGGGASLFGLTDPPRSGGGSEYELILEALVHVLKETAATGAWIDHGGSYASVIELHGFLFVTAAPDTQVEVAAFLNRIHTAAWDRAEARKTLVQRLQTHDKR